MKGKITGALEFRPDWPEARERLAAWWNGEDIGRPAMQITVPRDEPAPGITEMAEPEGWITHYSASNLEYRVNRALVSAASSQYFGEAVPFASAGDLAPNCLALYLGCEGVEMPETVWARPCMRDAESAQFTYDPDNRYWKFSLTAFSEVRKQAGGKMLQQFPDLIEGLDTLAAMRGTQNVLEDLCDRPAWVHASLRRITDLYFRYYDVLYDLLRDDVGGSVFWAWAPGRMVKLQCDFSAMISPAMFGEFMVPVLSEMTERTSYSMYHWDGPGAICHHDHLLSIPNLDMLQWTPGAGVEQTCSERWWPLYHKTLEAGRKLFITGVHEKEQLLAFRREFGEQCKGILFAVSVPTPEDARECISAMEF